MKYYVKDRDRIEGPLTVSEINSRIACGSVDAGSLATSDLGERPEQVAKASAHEWFGVADIPGVVGLPAASSQRSTQPESSHRLILIWSVLLVVMLIGIFLVARFLHVWSWL